MLEKRLIPLLLILASFAPVLAVSFTPALPEIANHLYVSSSKAQQSISIFLIGYAFGNLPWGPIANRFGRKKQQDGEYLSL